jgi:pimeloyl-ACP methyl ester carboxylesterase
MAASPGAASPPRPASPAPLSKAIPDSELVVFEHCAHAPIHEDVDWFNQQTQAFLQRHSG